MILSAISHPLAPTPRFGAKRRPGVSLAENERLWDANAPAWERTVGTGGNRFHQEFLYPAIRGFVGSVRDKEVLDLGCGEGAFCRQFAEDGAKSVTGIDLSSNMLKAARKQDPKTIRYLHRSFTNLRGIPDASMDLAFSTMTLMSSPGLDDFFKESYRVLRPGGQLVLVIKHPFSLWQQHQQAQGDDRISYFDDTPFARVTDLQEYDPATEPVPMTSIHYPRTFSTYLNSLLQAGFQLEAMAEPAPDNDAVARVSALAPWQHNPATLMIKATKPRLSTTA